MSDWQSTRRVVMGGIELYYRKQGITPQQRINRIRSCEVYKCSHKESATLGMWSYLQGDLEAENAYDEAIKAGATQITIPLEVGETGELMLECTCQMEFQGQCGDKTSRIELTIFEHNVWTCPRCDKVWALRNMAAMEDDDDPTQE